MTHYPLDTTVTPVFSEPGPDITEEEVEWAGSSFGPWAAQSQDVFHPAHYKLAGREVFRMVGRLLKCWEIVGCMPT